MASHGARRSASTILPAIAGAHTLKQRRTATGPFRLSDPHSYIARDQSILMFCPHMLRAAALFKTYVAGTGNLAVPPSNRQL